MPTITAHSLIDEMLELWPVIDADYSETEVDGWYIAFDLRERGRRISGEVTVVSPDDEVWVYSVTGKVWSDDFDAGIEWSVG